MSIRPSARAVRQFRQLLLRASRAINQDVTLALHAAGFKDLKNSQVFCLAHIDLATARPSSTSPKPAVSAAGREQVCR